MSAVILVVRKFDDFSRSLSESGFRVINCPAIETVRSESARGIGAKIAANNYDGIFLTSRAAAEILAGELPDKNFRFGGTVFVLGKKSFEILKDSDLEVFFDESADTAREMLAAIAPEALENKRFLFLRGDRSLRAIPEFLETTSATVDEVVVYETRNSRIDESLKAEIRAAADKDEIRAACFFSPSGAESFLEQFGARILHQTKIASIGETTADFLEKQNLKVDFTSSKASAEDFALELTQYLRNGRRIMKNEE